MVTYASRYCKERKARLKALGICQDCGQGKAEPERTLCEYCLGSRRLHDKLTRPHVHPSYVKKPVRSVKDIDLMMRLAKRVS